MDDFKILFLVPKNAIERLEDLVGGLGFDFACITFVSAIEEISDYYQSFGVPHYLISYSTSVIVPAKYLVNPSQVSVNIHAATPEYPGRDPHHFAKYEDAEIYGATLHYMTEKVDSGQIICVDLFDTLPTMSPIDLMLEADESAWRLIKKLLTWIREQQPFPTSKLVWSPKKRSRKEFQAFCKIDQDIDKEELERRVNAFHVPGYCNLYIEICGRKFFYKEDI
jgi:methionyl-tRNA formyltransferase